jgi:hypothetical protein
MVALPVLAGMEQGSPRFDPSVGHVTNLIAIDPGDIHVGVAFFDRDPESPHGWRCVDTQEMLPDEFADSLAELFVDQDDDWEFLVYEKFRLYEDKAEEQTGSEFPTAKLIGVIEWLGRKHNEHAAIHRLAESQGKLTTCELPGGVCAVDRADGVTRNPRAIRLVKQPADIMKPTKGNLRFHGIKSTAKKNGDTLGHQVAAELHGWYFILHTLEGE